jgi:uncharacterized protein (TIGR01244 family)
MPLNTRQLAPGFAVAAQLSPQDMPAVVQAGFRTLINNRPDHEGGAAQPLSADIAQAANALGLVYIHLPVISGAITAEQARAMKQTLDGAAQPVLAFCRSGARSAQLYERALGR